MGSQRVGYGLATEQQSQNRISNKRGTISQNAT